jgi:hypothetical protein
MKLHQNGKKFQILDLPNYEFHNFVGSCFLIKSKIIMLEGIKFKNFQKTSCSQA